MTWRAPLATSEERVKGNSALVRVTLPADSKVLTASTASGRCQIVLTAKLSNGRRRLFGRLANPERLCRRPNRLAIVRHVGPLPRRRKQRWFDVAKSHLPDLQTPLELERCFSHPFQRHENPTTTKQNHGAPRRTTHNARHAG